MRITGVDATLVVGGAERGEVRVVVAAARRADST